MTRRQVDDQSPGLALANRGQRGSNDLDMPIERQLDVRIEILEAARDEGGEILPQQGLVLGGRQVVNHQTPVFCRAAGP